MSANALAATDLKIVSQPKSVMVEKGEMATVRIIAEGEGLTYKWYYKNPKSSKYVLTKSFNGNTYNVSMTNERSGRSVYCVITDKYGNTKKTNAVTLSIRKPLKIVKQPTSVTVKKGAKATVKVVAEGNNLKYKWYYKNYGQPDYKYTSTVTGNSYSLTMSESRSGRCVYCVITDDMGNSVMTDVVSLNMKSLSIETQPQSVTAEEGETASVKVFAKGTNLKYQWYYKDVGKTQYSLAEKCTGSTYSMTMSKENSGRFVYCVVSDNYGNSKKTQPAYLLMNTELGPVITKQPQDPICSVGDNIEMSVAVDGLDPHFMWQYTTDGEKWYDCNVEKDTYNLCATDEAFERSYRCYIFDDYGNSCVTNTVKLLCKSNLIVSQPKNWVGCQDGTVIFEIEVLDSVVSCQWQISNNGGVTWSDSSANDIFYSTIATTSRIDNLYRCVVKDADGSEQISNVVSFSLTDDFYIAAQPKDITAKYGQEVYFSIQAGGTNVKFQWQRSEDGKNWSNFGAKKARTGQTIQRYNIGKYYRCVVTNETGETLISNVVKLNWNGTGFFIEDGKKYYVKNDGTIATGIQNINGNIYCFSDSGIMRTGLIKQNDNIYYFNNSGVAAIGFTYVPEAYSIFYFDNNGVAAKGWTKINGNTHYFYDSGAMAWGVTQIGDAEYFFDQVTGAQTFGLVQVGPNNYMYFQEGEKSSYVGLKKINGKLYYFAESGGNRGITLGGRQTISKTTYYFDPITKQAVTGMVEDNGKISYFGSDYTMVTNKMVTVDGNTYYFNSKGNMSYGLENIDGKRYYFDESTGAAVGGWVELSGATLYFDPITYQAKTGFVTINGMKYNFNSKGYLKTGISKISGTYYYLTKPDESKTGFIEVNKKVYYVNKNQKLAKGLKTINKKLYYFDDNCVMRTGLRSVGGVRYYFDLKTGAAVTGFVETNKGVVYYFNGASGAGSGLTKIKGDLYYLSSNGIVRYGRTKIGKKIYYFDPSSGKALTGWQSIVSGKIVRKAYFDPKTCCAVTGLKKIGGKLYYFDSNGWAKSGNRKVNGVTYFFSPGTNEAYTGWYKNKDGSHSYYNGSSGKLIGPGVFKINGKYYYIDAKGIRLTGERTVKGKKMYFDPVTAERVSKKPTNSSSSSKVTAPSQPKKSGVWGTINGAKCFYGMNGKRLTGLQTIDDKLYYFDKNGKMKTGMHKVNGAYYYFGKSGAETGLKKIKGKQYYFSPISCQRLTGIQKIGNVYYYFDEKGVRQNGWVTTKSGDRLYVTNKGVQTGLAKIGKKTYYFGEDGVMRTGVQQVTTSSGKIVTYLFDKKGVMVTGFVKDNNGIYYYSTKTGARITGFTKISGKEYYFDTVTGKAKTGLNNIDGVYCYFDTKTAQRKYGLQKVVGKLYYFTDSTSDSGLYKGLKVVNKKTYFFSTSSGIAVSGYREIDDVMYYFDRNTFATTTTIQRMPNGAAYLFDAKGGIKKGWQNVGGNTYYFYLTTGKMAEGLASVNDKLYYFDYSKGMLKNTNVTVAGVTYKIDENGFAVATGETNMSKIINTGISHFDKGYGRDGDTENPENFTCSQLVIAVYNSIGVELPERGAKQYNALINGSYDITIVESLNQAKPGDLIWFNTVNCSYDSKCDFWNEIHHVAIYVGDGKIMGSFDIKGDTDNNGPMIRDLNLNSTSSTVYSIVRLNDISKN